MSNRNMFLEDYVFKGEYVDKVVKLTSKIDDSNASIFSSTIELFIFSSLVGSMLGLRNKPSKDSSHTTKIFASQFSNHAEDLKLAFKFVMLMGTAESLDDVTKLNRTFRHPDKDENYQIFEEYMLGGLTEIYNSIFVDSNNKYEDYLTAVNNLMGKLVDKDNNDDNEISTEDFF